MQEGFAVKLHADARHHPARRLVIFGGEGHHFRQVQRVEGVRQRGARRLSGVAVAPVSRRQPSANLHAGGARQIVARPRQPDKTDKRRAAFHFHRP